MFLSSTPFAPVRRHCRHCLSLDVNCVLFNRLSNSWILMLYCFYFVCFLLAIKKRPRDCRYYSCRFNCWCGSFQCTRYSLDVGVVVSLLARNRIFETELPPTSTKRTCTQKLLSRCWNTHRLLHGLLSDHGAIVAVSLFCGQLSLLTSYRCRSWPGNAEYFQSKQSPLWNLS